MAVMLGYLKVPLTWGEVLRRTFHEAFFKDNCLGMAAQLAYYFFFALFPTLLVMLAIAGKFFSEGLVFDTFALLGGFVPAEALTLIIDQIRKIHAGQQGGLLTLGRLAAVWSSSAAMTAIIDTLNNAYDVEEGRPWWKVRLLAIALTIGGAVFILLATALVLAGPVLASYLADWWYLGAAFEWAWNVLQWPLVFGLVTAAVSLIYYFAPDVEQEWTWLVPGAVVATVLWLLATLGFKYYVVNLGSYTESYGALGAVMVLLLWFYLSGFAILIGAELNAEIEHASPGGKDPGEKVQGQKQQLGSFFRKWVRRRQSQGGKPPSAGEVRELLDKAGGRDAADGPRSP